MSERETVEDRHSFEAQCGASSQQPERVRKPVLFGSRFLLANCVCACECGSSIGRSKIRFSTHTHTLYSYAHFCACVCEHKIRTNTLLVLACVHKTRFVCLCAGAPKIARARAFRVYGCRVYARNRRKTDHYCARSASARRRTSARAHGENGNLASAYMCACVRAAGRGRSFRRRHGARRIICCAQDLKCACAPSTANACLG